MLILVPLHTLASAPSLHLLWRRHCLRPGAKGAFRGSESPNENCAPLSEDCAPMKVTGSVPLEGSSRPPKYWSSPQNSWARTVLSQILRWRPFFVCVFLVFTHEFEGTKFLCPQKNYLCLPSYATLAPDIQISKFVCSSSWNDWRWRYQRRIQVIQTPAQTGLT